jgi:WD40 repeat protein
LELWDVQPPKSLWQKTLGPVRVRLALSPDGKRAAWIDDTGKVSSQPAQSDNGKPWEFASGLEPAPINSVGLAFSGDSRKLATFSHAQVRIFDAETGASTGTPIQFESPIFDLALDENGTRVIAALENRQLVILDAASSEVISSHPFATDTTGGGNMVVSREDRSIYAVFGDNNVNNPRVWRWRLELEDVADALTHRLPQIMELDQTPKGK